MNKQAYSLKFTPHIGMCSVPFEVSSGSKEGIVHIAMALTAYQAFLANNNHSQYPKARAEFRTHGALDVSLLKKLNEHKYHDLEDADDLATCDDANEWGLRLSWFPQVPCKPFIFPVKDVEAARALSDALADYDIYLLEKCDQMRVDYCNTLDLEMRPDNYQQMIDDGDIPEENQGWMSWYFEDDEKDIYFEDFQDWLRAQRDKEEQEQEA